MFDIDQCIKYSGCMIWHSTRFLGRLYKAFTSWEGKISMYLKYRICSSDSISLLFRRSVTQHLNWGREYLEEIDVYMNCISCIKNRVFTKLQRGEAECKDFYKYSFKTPGDAQSMKVFLLCKEVAAETIVFRTSLDSHFLAITHVFN